MTNSNTTPEELAQEYAASSPDAKRKLQHYLLNPSTIPSKNGHSTEHVLLAMLAQLSRDPASKNVLERLLGTMTQAQRDLLTYKISALPTVDLTQLTEAAQAVELRYQVRTMADALKPQPEFNWIVEDILRPEAITVFAGAAGSKKTYSLMWLAMCVGLGIPWLGRATRRTKILFVDEESGELLMGKRLTECAAGAGGNDTVPIQYISSAGFNLRDDTDIQLFKAAVQNSGAELVIIDSLAAIMAGGDENTVKDVQPIFNTLKSISKACNGCSFAIIHHAGKNGDSRGSSAINGACDLLMLVESKTGSPNVDFTSIKQRVTAPQRLAAVCVWEPGAFSMRETVTLSGDDRHYTKAQNYVMEFLKEHGPSTVAAIQTAADVCSAGMARKAVYQLADMRAIVRANKGAGLAQDAVYELTNNE